MIDKNQKALSVIESYPEEISEKVLAIRALIERLGAESEFVDQIEETLKWGEPSYLSDIGSTIRLTWKKNTPNRYYIYFICSTKLIDTFRELYSEEFKFEGNRAIVFELDDEIPEKALSHCLSMALCYHKVKHLPLLGA